jgi:hypothetical protein
MEKLKEFQEVARKHGFVDVEESENGTVLWLRRPTAEAEDRMCIDSVSKSATLYWATIPWQIKLQSVLCRFGPRTMVCFRVQNTEIAGNSEARAAEKITRCPERMRLRPGVTRK